MSRCYARASRGIVVRSDVHAHYCIHSILSVVGSMGVIRTRSAHAREGKTVRKIKAKSSAHVLKSIWYSYSRTGKDFNGPAAAWPESARDRQQLGHRSGNRHDPRGRGRDRHRARPRQGAHTRRRGAARRFRRHDSRCLRRPRDARRLRLRRRGGEFRGRRCGHPRQQCRRQDSSGQPRMVRGRLERLARHVRAERRRRGPAHSRFRTWNEGAWLRPHHQRHERLGHATRGQHRRIPGGQGSDGQSDGEPRACARPHRRDRELRDARHDPDPCGRTLAIARRAAAQLGHGLGRDRTALHDRDDPALHGQARTPRGHWPDGCAAREPAVGLHDRQATIAWTAGKCARSCEERRIAEQIPEHGRDDSTLYTGRAASGARSSAGETRSRALARDRDGRRLDAGRAARARQVARRILADAVRLASLRGHAESLRPVRHDARRTRHPFPARAVAPCRCDAAHHDSRLARLGDRVSQGHCATDRS